jgi:hypothetical protein
VSATWSSSKGRDAVRHIGRGRFWVSTMGFYSVLLGRSGLLSQALVDDWRAFQVQSAADNTPFGACNYYTYLARRPA